ncbi:unnamed protein product, partial [Ectocarpus sp. 4 AP-2014]
NIDQVPFFKTGTYLFLFFFNVKTTTTIHAGFAHFVSCMNMRGKCNPRRTSALCWRLVEYQPPQEKGTEQGTEQNICRPRVIIFPFQSSSRYSTYPPATCYRQYILLGSKSGLIFLLPKPAGTQVDIHPPSPQ